MRYVCTLLAGLAAAVAPAADLDVRVSSNTDKLMPYQVLELTFQHDGPYRDPTWDVTIGVVFRSPGGKDYRVGGFFYGSSKPQNPILGQADARGQSTAAWPCDPADLWKARFAPSELGAWRYDYVFEDNRGGREAGSGRFEVVKGRVPQKGFLRIDPKNGFRLVFDDGSPYFPIGYQDGVHDGNQNGSAMDAHAVEGPFRPDPEGKRPTPPAGPMFARGPAMGPMNGDVTVGRHARAGFNLWRFSPNNFSIKVFASPQNAEQSSLDHVRWEQALMVDEMLLMMRKYGIRSFYGIFGYTKVFTDQPQDAEGMAKVKRLVKYSVDRWGAYVDFWEFLNEQHADARWYEVLIPYLRSIDPYQHPVSTSWERPELNGIEICAPHWYGNESELESDRVTVERGHRFRRFGKPIIFGEQGNSRGREDRSAEGIGGVWDPGSARRMRVRNWTTMFQEMAFIFWETSYAKDGHFMNLWIGPEERQYVKAMQDFAGRLDGGERMVEVPLAGTQAHDVRAYGLRSQECAAVYLHHAACEQCRRAGQSGRHAEHRWDHDRSEVKGLEVALDVPKASKAYWYRPSDGEVLARSDVQPGKRTLVAPPFEVDLALLVTDRGVPDADNDGRANDVDSDDDNDGVADAQDAWPLEREEWADADRDRIGDQHDADLDGDGKGDDRDGNGKPDHEEPDWDGDGVANADAIPWDAFPRDPREWRDTDGDGIGDNADPDDDGDGYSDAEEKQAGTDPLDAVRFP